MKCVTLYINDVWNLKHAAQKIKYFFPQFRILFNSIELYKKLKNKIVHAHSNYGISSFRKNAQPPESSLDRG